MNKEYFFNTNERGKIESFLSEGGEFTVPIERKDDGRLADLYNFPPTLILLYNDADEIEFFGKFPIRISYSKSQLEKGAEIVLE